MHLKYLGPLWNLNSSIDDLKGANRLPCWEEILVVLYEDGNQRSQCYFDGVCLFLMVLTKWSIIPAPDVYIILNVGILMDPKSHLITDFQEMQVRWTYCNKW